MFRSRDKEFMKGIQTSLLAVTKGQEKDDRKYALDYLRAHVRIDDLHHMALKKFPNKIIDFGSGSYNPKIVVVTKDPISEDAKNKLRAAWKRLNLTEDDVYYLHLRFVKTKRKQEERKEIVNKMLTMLSPALTVVFDNVELDIPKEKILMNANISILTDNPDKEARKRLTTELRQAKKNKVF